MDGLILCTILNTKVTKKYIFVSIHQLNFGSGYPEVRAGGKLSPNLLNAPLTWAKIGVFYTQANVSFWTVNYSGSPGCILPRVSLALGGQG